MVANDAGLADDHARAVVYSEVFAYAGTGVYVDTRLRMSLFRNDTWYDGNLHLVQCVGCAVVGHGVHHRIAEYHLPVCLGSRVVIEHGFHVGVQHALYFRQFVNEPEGQSLGLFLHVAATFRAELQSAGYLSAQQLVQLLHVYADDVGAHPLVGLPLMEIIGENDAFHYLDNPLHFLHRRQWCPCGWHHAVLFPGVRSHDGHIPLQYLVNVFLSHLF